MLIKLVIFLHSINIFFLVLFGSIYLFKKTCMSYHVQALGLAWQDVPVNTRLIILALMKIAGSGWLAAAAALIYLLILLASQGSFFICAAIFSIELLIWVPSTYVTFKVSSNTGAKTPWLLCLLLFCLAFITFLISMCI